MLQVDREKLYQQASDSKSQYKVVKAKVDKSVGDAFIEWTSQNKLTAVFRIITDYKREYPMNNLLSSVLGFVAAIISRWKGWRSNTTACWPELPDGCRRPQRPGGRTAPASCPMRARWTRRTAAAWC